MNAYEVKSGTKVKVKSEEVFVPPGALPVLTGDEITIHRLDGMYCNGVNKDGDRIYINALTEVEVCS
jgi:hypothetical protein